MGTGQCEPTVGLAIDTFTVAIDMCYPAPGQQQGQVESETLEWTLSRFKSRFCSFLVRPWASDLSFLSLGARIIKPFLRG